MSKNTRADDKTKKTVLTVRIDEDLDQVLDDLRLKRGISKASVIRNFLEMAKYVIIDTGSIRSLDERDLIILKRKMFRKLLEEYEERDQMEFGIKLARFINDIARLQGRLDDLEYKLNLIEHLGFFRKKTDAEGYIIISNRFGPKKFIEAFTYKLINYDPDKKYDITFTEEQIEDSSRTKKSYMNTIQPVSRVATYYSYEFAKLDEKSKE
ncbi:MAG: hypothetical protein GF383_03385 [Candidatus Lokiarchaeota archaeon]|nr:hypothetical protein [Candidatus Lokiarchaeota archaeon]MBD3338677.1 hypothetical protein [Candidatus Lokiarchaeota archaeon]